MKIYISGKIGDLDMSDVRPKFGAAQDWLSHLGHVGVNPLDCHHADSVCPTPTEWKHYMLNDIAELFDCDGILMLSDWQDSPGAKVEHAICQAMGKAVFYAASEVPQQI